MSGKLAVLQAPLIDGLFFNPFSLFDHGIAVATFRLNDDNIYCSRIRSVIGLLTEMARCGRYGQMDNQKDEHEKLSQQAIDAIEHAIAYSPVLAVEKAQALVARHTDNGRAHRLLAAALRALDRYDEAAHVDVAAIQASARSKPLQQALGAMRASQLETAEQILRSYLSADPDDPQALRMLAEISAVCGYLTDAELLLRRAMDQAPGFVPLYINLATLLQDMQRSDEAIALLDELLAEDPAQHLVLSIKAGLLASSRRTGEALIAYDELLAAEPGAVDAWVNYAEVLKTLGRGDDAVHAYRKAIDLDPRCGAAWWGLASLRASSLRDDDISAIQNSLLHATDDLNRLKLHFALGRALGDRQRFEESFSHYVIANEMRSQLIPYDPYEIEKLVRDAKPVFTEELLQINDGGDIAKGGPIFIIGLPRSGSSLVEQILATHPEIEGTGELFDLDRIVQGYTASTEGLASWPEAIACASPEDLRNIGEEYLDSVRHYRSTDAPFFTDKMPFNWRYAALIPLILPNARIIDVRRHSMACCFSNYTLYFNQFTNFASNLEDLGAYYGAYVGMIEHLDDILPGRVHRVIYENLVSNPEREIRSLLGYLALPFDSDCLRFHENPREVYTPSAEQVRRPISDKGVEFWRNYEPWLAPLKEALGPDIQSVR